MTARVNPLSILTSTLSRRRDHETVERSSDDEQIDVAVEGIPEQVEVPPLGLREPQIFSRQALHSARALRPSGLLTNSNVLNRPQFGRNNRLAVDDRTRVLRFPKKGDTSPIRYLQVRRTCLMCLLGTPAVRSRTFNGTDSSELPCSTFSA